MTSIHATTIHSNDLLYRLENTTNINIDIATTTLNPEVSQMLCFSAPAAGLAPPCFPAN